MLVFSPLALPQIFDSLITNFQPSLRDATPANTLYMLARFACLTCDHTWLEDLIIGATDAIEDTFFVCRSPVIGPAYNELTRTLESRGRRHLPRVLALQYYTMASFDAV